LSQYYPQQPSPFYPPEQSPENDFYEEAEYEYEDEAYETSGDTLVQRGLLFCAGGCLVFLCMSCCLLLGMGLWILDPGSSLVATTIPGSDIGLTFDQPAYSNESVVNEQNVKLTILEVNRNAALATAPQVEGNELIVVTIELVNLSGDELDFNERDFMLLNRFEERHPPIPGVVEGALGRGILPPDSGLEGRLVFEVAAGELDLVLVWEGGADSGTRYIYLE
jgi:hypothetical protein